MTSRVQDKRRCWVPESKQLGKWRLGSSPMVVSPSCFPCQILLCSLNVVTNSVCQLFQDLGVTTLPRNLWEGLCILKNYALFLSLVHQSSVASSTTSVYVEVARCLSGSEPELAHTANTVALGPKYHSLPYYSCWHNAIVWGLQMFALRIHLVTSHWLR